MVYLPATSGSLLRSESFSNTTRTPHTSGTFYQKSIYNTERNDLTTLQTLGKH